MSDNGVLMVLYMGINGETMIEKGELMINYTVINGEKMGISGEIRDEKLMAINGADSPSLRGARGVSLMVINGEESGI